MYLKTEEMVDRQDLIVKIKEKVKQFEQDLKEDKIEYKK